MPCRRSRATPCAAATRSASSVYDAGGRRPSARPYMSAPFACRRKDPVMPPPTDARALLDALVAKARRAGADAADAVLFEGVSLSHAQRLGNTEKLERSESYDLGLRVLLGKRQAIVSSNDRGAERFDELVARAMPGVTNSEGAEASWGRSRVMLLASNGFAGGYASTGHSVSVSVLAGEGMAMERDDDFSSAVHAGDLRDPQAVGRTAGERAVRRLGARKVPTCQVPVVYDPRVASSLVRHLAGAISGPAIARRTSFLQDKLGKRIFPASITIIDDPHRRRGLRSKPFDGEGIANARRAIIEDGVLTTWLLDLTSARQLGLRSTGHAARGTSSPPGPSPNNLWLEPGPITAGELIGDIDKGFYVTELMGMGVNGVTGDYSRGAAGFWIERGKLAYPVSEVTVAGNLKDMFQHLTAASDLEFKTGIDAPTLRVDGMTIAGA